MLILYVGMKYDYGDPARGLSFEHHNFYECLKGMGYDILYFDFSTLLEQRGRSGMNRRLSEVVASENPDLMFTCLFTDQFDKRTIRDISASGHTKTFNWFCDDHWRFENFSQHWAPCFHWVSTTASSAVPKYQDMGYANLVKTQWACNPFTYRKLDLPYRYDVSFVGQPHGTRREVIQALRERGIDVQTFGYGWKSGRISQTQMIEVFNQSRINLNLSNASTTGRPRGLKAKLSANLKRLASMMKKHKSTKSSDSSGGDPHAAITVTNPGDQIKGRNFEVPGCGGFMMTGQADNLEAYYRPEKEISTFRRVDEMAQKICDYLDDDERRQSVADAGYERTRCQHTYVHRFAEIFSAMGLPTPEVDKILSPDCPRGNQDKVA